MALVNITNIVLDDKPQPFTSNITMDIHFEVQADIEDEIEWTLIYIGAPKDESYDQVLEQFSMGPLPKGVMQFTLESNPPDYKKIPSKEDLLGMTAFILTCSYRQQEFFRVGYYVYNAYTSPENIENEPPEILIEDISRQILCDKPRTTKFEIDWHKDPKEKPQMLELRGYMQQDFQEKPSADATEIDDHQHLHKVFDS